MKLRHAREVANLAPDVWDSSINGISSSRNKNEEFGERVAYCVLIDLPFLCIILFCISCPFFVSAVSYIWIHICVIISSLTAVLFATCDFWRYKVLFKWALEFRAILRVFDFRLSSRPIVVFQSRKVFFLSLSVSCRIISRRFVGVCVCCPCGLETSLRSYSLSIFALKYYYRVLVVSSDPIWEYRSESIGRFKIKLGIAWCN